jgi:large subunit ribosomal protein L4
MPVVDVINLDGKKVGQVDLADTVFGAEVNEHLLHEASRWYLRGLRSGTAKTKDKSEVSGAGRKLWKQKGTGRARIGSIRSPLWRHGGTVHGPKPRSYEYALPKKMQLGALRSALSAKLAEQKLIVIEAWSLDTHKTKALRLALGKLNAEKNGFAGCWRRKSQPGACQSQYGRRKAFRDQYFAGVRRPSSRSSAAFEGCRGSPGAHTRSGSRIGGRAPCGIHCSGTSSSDKERSGAESQGGESG